MSCNYVCLKAEHLKLHTPSYVLHSHACSAELSLKNLNVSVMSIGAVTGPLGTAEAP